MAELMTLTVRPRAEKGKGPCRRIRTSSLVPGIYYNKQGQNLPVQVEMLPLTKLYSKLGASRVFNLQVEQDGKVETLPVLFKNVQYDPIKSSPIHVDFYGVDLDRDIKVEVRVVVEGKAKGIILGGQLEIFRNSLEVVCKPLDVPQKIVIDVTDLDIGVNLHVADVKLPEGVRAVYDDNYAVVGVVAVESDEPKAEAESK
ncbi:large subunit ribosomal protein L25 [Humidesulfovibrio mexicanus]|uniref:Large ribosomal subunit protein bL25 n=1 Tax=Humidesulfovibrio mexicanus TaxID=147047 RepID=A0A238XL48_9BACT|nr:50S ribosomal protein L25/general stress protein Ctc [Humidesulfovibrio mexicanus]SNR59657.1 large subunit ribosomal protein L25 [Humidesulfovibrio mexicanus]